MAPPNRRGAVRLARCCRRRIARTAIPAIPRARPSEREEEFDFMWKEGYDRKMILIPWKFKKKFLESFIPVGNTT